MAASLYPCTAEGKELSWTEGEEQRLLWCSGTGRNSEENQGKNFKNYDWAEQDIHPNKAEMLGLGRPSRNKGKLWATVMNAVIFQEALWTKGA